MDALIQAVALDSDGHYDTAVSQDFLLQICSNFILVTQSGCAKFAHRSVKEYLMQCDVAGAGEGDFHPSKAHTQAAETCLVFLVSLENEALWGKLPADAHEYTKDLHLTSFEMYACYFWASHCELSGNLEPDKGILSTLLRHLLVPRMACIHNTASEVGSPDSICVSTAFRKWISLLWRVFHTPHDLSGSIRQRLEDAISTPPDPIFTTCIWGLTHHAACLLNHDPQSVNANNHRGKSPLFLACEHGHKKLAQILVQSKAALDFQHSTWGTVFQAAAYTGDPSMFDYLLGTRALVKTTSKKIDLNAPGGCYGHLLDAAINGGDEQIITSAIRQGIDICLPVETQEIPAMGARFALLSLPKKLARKNEYGHQLWKAKGKESYPEQQHLDPHHLQALFPMGHKSFLHRLQLGNLRRRQILTSLELCRKLWPARFSVISFVGGLCGEVDYGVCTNRTLFR